VKQVVIENPVINSAFKEPACHFRFTEEGITDEIIESRRTSVYFVPIAPPKKKGKQGQLALGTEWTQDRLKENKFINRVRECIKMWRDGGYVDTTRTTARLLEYWNAADRERKLFFCQIEALETLIYITEVAKKYGDTWIDNELRDAQEIGNSQLFRIAFKMATGSGKTVVMAMIIAWHTLNKRTHPQDARLSDTVSVCSCRTTLKPITVSVMLSPAVSWKNSAWHSGFGRWSFLEITDPWDAKNSIRKYLGQPIEEAIKP
jgi:type III restriction enzyme